MPKPLISGYLVVGRFLGSKTYSGYNAMVLRRGLLCWSNRGTIFSTHRRAQSAIKRTQQERVALMGENDIYFQIIPVEHTGGGKS